MTGESTVLEQAGVRDRVTAADADFHRVTGGGAPAARAHGGDPQGGRVAQVVGGSGVRAARVTLRLGRDISRAGSAAVTAVMAALDAVAPGAGCHCGAARAVLVLAGPGKGFDGPAEI